MKKRYLSASLIMFVLAALVSFSGGVIKAEGAQTFEKATFISGVVTANELNLRTGPSLKSEIIGVFKKNKWVNVLAVIDGWYAVFDPDTGKVGCVKKEYLMDPAMMKKTGTTKPSQGRN